MKSAAILKNNNTVKTVVFLLALFASAFYTLPQSFASSSFSQEKLNLYSEAETDIAEELDVKNEQDAETGFDQYVNFSQFLSSEIIIDRIFCAFRTSAFHSNDYKHKSIYALNCSYIFYG